MKRLILLVTGLSFSALALGGEVVDKQLDADPSGEVVIDIVRGAITVVGWDRAVVHVKGERDEKSEEFIFAREGNVIRISDELKSRRSGGDASGTHITVQVPRNSSVEMETVSANQDVREINGVVRLDSVSGAINAAGLERSANLASVSGDITLKGGSGEVRVDSVSGNVKVEINAQRLQAESVSGDVEVENAGMLQRLDASTVSGNLLIRTALAPEAEADLESVSGDVDLELRGELNVRFNLKTGPGGDIENGLSDLRPDRERYTGAESLELRLGQGGADVDASVISGTITIRRQ
ncbi:MAG: hypothetical protein A3H91_15650 [Gammaproteobacteria bacterium RIFCSPLOWO2_02_FULL_61_13]|nr:MAG: hypothetical protein A3H91_15650 [Gammaproteobacteria bacterium RIFCSPLOWO2_02_FULL_61_13]